MNEFYLFSDVSGIDPNKNVDEKTEQQVVKEITILLSKAIPLSVLNREAKNRNPDVPYFPVNGSASRMNPIYEDLILRK